MTDLTLDELKTEIKELIIQTLKIEDVQPANILDDVPLLGGENIITIDSIDVIDVVMAIQKKYQVRIDDQNLARHIINTVNTIADFVYLQKIKAGEILP